MRKEVLVVEDVEEQRAALALTLRRAGFSARPAATGEQGLALYRQHREGVALALLDVRLSGRLDGARTMQALRWLDPDLPCVFVTGDDGYSAEDLLARGASQVLPKPYQPDELLGVVRRLAGGDGGA
jgi:CheY-like chemotaxis protein